MKKEMIEVKQIDWFDDHFYKIRYINEAKVEIEDYFPSTTTKLGAIAKPFLIGWYGDLGTREATLRRDEAAETGTRLHWAWYNYCEGNGIVYQQPQKPVYTEEEMTELRAKFPQIVVLTKQEEMYNMTKLEQFVKVVKPTFLFNEVIVYDIEHREAGQVDNIIDIEEGKYKVNGLTPLSLPKGRYIFDLKSGKSVGKEAKMQLADYAIMAEKGGYGPIEGALIAHTQSKNKNGIEGFGLIYLDKKAIQEEYSDFRDIAKVWDRNFGNRKPVIRQIPGLISLNQKEVADETTTKGK